MSTAPAVRRLAPLVVASLLLCGCDAGAQGLSESTGVGQYSNCSPPSPTSRLRQPDQEITWTWTYDYFVTK